MSFILSGTFNHVLRSTIQKGCGIPHQSGRGPGRGWRAAVPALQPRPRTPPAQRILAPDRGFYKRLVWELRYQLLWHCGWGPLISLESSGFCIHAAADKGRTVLSWPEIHNLRTLRQLRGRGHDEENPAILDNVTFGWCIFCFGSLDFFVCWLVVRFWTQSGCSSIGLSSLKQERWREAIISQRLGPWPSWTFFLKFAIRTLPSASLGLNNRKRPTSCLTNRTSKIISLGWHKTNLQI